MVNPVHLIRPLNTSATLEDIMHALRIVQPTHIATIPEKLSTVEAALASVSMKDVKIMTVLGKVQNLPQVSNTSLLGPKGQLHSLQLNADMHPSSSPKT